MATILKTLSLAKRTTKIVDSDFLIPANAKGELELILELDPVELTDTSRSLWINVFELRDGNWRHVAGMQWVGGENFDEEFGKNFNPRLWFPAERVAGKTIRVEIDDPKGTQVGYKLTLKG